MPTLMDFIEDRDLSLPPHAVRICSLLAEGLTSPQISRRIGRSVTSIDVYIHRVMRRTGASNRQELVSIASSLTYPQ
jgi:DNA-binding NarL/FixJ family response regulator